LFVKQKKIIKVVNLQSSPVITRDKKTPKESGGAEEQALTCKLSGAARPSFHSIHLALKLARAPLSLIP
jgi:hypothetical protein